MTLFVKFIATNRLHSFKILYYVILMEYVTICFIFWTKRFDLADTERGDEIRIIVLNQICCVKLFVLFCENGEFVLSI